MRIRHIALSLAGLAALATVCYGVLMLLSSSRPPRAVHPFFRAPARNLAHRGGAKLAPEATLPAFHASSAAGADVLEMDVRLTADGVLIVIHDALVDRTTDGTGPVAGKKLSELRRLNAGHHFQTAEGRFSYREDPVPIPTFEEVQKAHPDRRFIVEMKSAETAEPLCRAIQAAGREMQTLVAAFDRESLRHFRGVCPGVATGAAFGEVVGFLALSYGRLPGLYDGAADALLVSETSGSLPVVTPRFLRSARRAGLPVIVWTVNRREEMERLLDLGVDGLLTDDPVTLAAVLADRR